jgi:nitrate/TMAO reductase-like tetraheme cytochrome c subunit
VASVHDFQAARARQAARVALKDAEAALAEAQSRLECHSGIGINLALVNRVRAAERRVEKAREALRAIEFSSCE